jgi:hypothetical protein
VAGAVPLQPEKNSSSGKKVAQNKSGGMQPAAEF